MMYVVVLHSTDTQSENLSQRFKSVDFIDTPFDQNFNTNNQNFQLILFNYKIFFEKYADRIVFGTDVSFAAGDPKYSMEHYSKLNREIYDAFTTDRKVSI